MRKLLSVYYGLTSFLVFERSHEGTKKFFTVDFQSKFKMAQNQEDSGGFSKVRYLYQTKTGICWLIQNLLP